MRKRVGRALLVGGAIAAAAMLGAGVAFAASTITITGAGGSISAFSTNAVISDGTSGQSFRCTSLSFSGSGANVTNAPLPYTWTGVGGSSNITGWSFAGCTSSFGSAMLTVPAADLPDELVFNAVSAAPPQASGFLQTGGALFRISVLTCSFNLSGQPNFTWTNGTSNQLRFVGNSLRPSNVSAGCFGEVNSTDTLTFTGTFTVSPNTIMIEPGQ